MKPTGALVNLAELDLLSREQLIARLLGMRQGATLALSHRHLQEMPKERLRLLFLIANLLKVARARKDPCNGSASTPSATVGA
jgi:hypothetical protein